MCERMSTTQICTRISSCLLLHQRDMPKYAFPQAESHFNGLITNDKFCMSRTTQLQFSWWRFPRKARQTISDEVESSVKGNMQPYLPQQERHEETTMEHSALLRADA